MTYLDFHLVFTLPLLVLVVFLNRSNELSFSRKSIYGLSLLCFLALSYTTPWDSYLIRKEIWTYSPGNVLGSLFYIPYEEYFFFFIQTIIGCLFTAFLLVKFKSSANHSLVLTPKNFAALFISWGIMLSLFLLLNPNETWLYMSLIVFWAFPILFMQWCIGLPVLLKEYKTWITSTVLLTSYFWFADGFAITQNIWSFPAGTISGLKIAGVLPIEEALFFLATNLMVVQGYILFTQVDFNKFAFKIK